MFLRRSRIGRKSISLSFYQPSIDFNRPDRNTTNLIQTTGTSQIFTSSEDQTSSEEPSQNQLGGNKPAWDIYLLFTSLEKCTSLDQSSQEKGSYQCGRICKIGRPQKSKYQSHQLLVRKDKKQSEPWARSCQSHDPEQPQKTYMQHQRQGGSRCYKHEQREAVGNWQIPMLSDVCRSFTQLYFRSLYCT